MSYPFPRHAPRRYAESRCSPAALNATAQQGSPPPAWAPWSPAWPAPAWPTTAGSLPGGCTATPADAAVTGPESGDSDGSEDIVFNEQFLHSFVAVEGGAARPAPGLATSISTLPQREDEASRAAQLEARQQRQHQELRYGSRASQVRGLEAVLNEGFDRVSRSHAPALWPSVPL